MPAAPAAPITRAARPLAIVAGLLAATATPALAHVGVGPVDGFVHGFTHPLGGWDHLLAMVAVGLWGAQGRGRLVWLLPLAFVLGMIGGGALGMTGIALPAVETGILLSVLLLGALVATAARLPLAASIAVVAAFGLFHGHAHGAEMPAATSALAYGLGFCMATAALHASGVAAALGLRALAGQVTGQTWIRIAGSAIGVAGCVLAVVR